MAKKFELTEEQKQMLEERAKLAKNPNAKFLTWDEEKKNLKRTPRTKKR